MKISMAILVQNLKDTYKFTYESHLSDKLNLNRPIFFNNSEILENKIYILYNSDLELIKNTYESTLFLSIGKVNPNKFTLSNHILEFSKDISPFDLFNSVQEVFDIYDNWDNQLQNILNDGGSIEDMVDIAFDIFNNPVIIFGADHSILSYTPIAKQLPDISVLVNPGELYDYLNLLKLDPLFNMVRDYKDPFLYPSHITGRRSIAANIFYHQKFTYRIVISESITEFRDGDIELLGHFRKYVKLLYEKNDILSSNKPHTLSQVFLSILSKEMFDYSEINLFFKEFKWLSEHNYFCMTIIVSCLDVQNLTSNSICSRIESLIPNSCAFLYKDNIVVFVNLTLSSACQDQITSSFFTFLRDGYLKCGISNTFTDFVDIRNYYKQARISLDIGLRRRTNYWMHKFEDVVYMYIGKSCTSELPTHLVCSKKILFLKEYDEVNSTDYYVTLRTYLENHLNAVKSAKQLFIHRSTFLYRLDRIKELVHINFGDFNLLLYISLSYTLLDEKVANTR